MSCSKAKADKESVALTQTKYESKSYFGIEYLLIKAQFPFKDLFKCFERTGLLTRQCTSSRYGVNSAL